MNLQTKKLVFTLNIQTFAEVTPTLKKTTFVHDAAGAAFDVSLNANAEIKKDKRVNKDYKKFVRVTDVEKHGMSIAQINPKDPKDGFTLTTLEKVKESLTEGYQKIDDVLNLVKGRSGDVYIKRTHTVTKNFTDKKFYYGMDVRSMKAGGKELDRVGRDIGSLEASKQITLRKDFLTTYGSAIGTINTGVVGLPWETKYKKTGAEDKFTATAVTSLAELVAAAIAGKRHITGVDFGATDEDKGEAIYEWLFETSGYLEKIGSDVEPEHPVIEDGIASENQGIVMDRSAAKWLKKYLAKASNNTSIVVEGGLITGIILDQVQIPIIIMNRRITSGGKKVYAAMHPMGENAPCSEFSVGEDYFEVIPSGTRTATNKDSVLNIDSAFYGTNASEPELLFAITA